MRNVRLALWALASVAALWSFSGVAMAEKRVALVVGNAAYEHTTKLVNTGNDATAMAKALRDLEFDVILGMDLDKRGFLEKLKEFKHKTMKASVALFFYAGHASQYQGVNYLTPIDAAEMEDELDYENHIELNRNVMGSMQSRTRLVFLDSCRNNPLKKRFMTRNMGGSTRSASSPRGLALVKSDGGSYIAYATEPGELAEDGVPGGNSPFTAALLEHIRTPMLDIGELTRRVRVSVLKNTDRKQLTWSSDSLVKSFIFSRSEAPKPGVYLRVGVDAGQKIEESHLKVVAKDRLSKTDIKGYSSIRGGCYSGKISAGTRLDGSYLAFCTQ